MNTGYIMLGSNLGDSRKSLADARKYLNVYAGTVLASSGLYETAPWGVSDKQNNYLNQALIIKTYKSPGQLINTCLAIERIMGRVRTETNAARIIDIDILLMDQLVVDQANLVLPHPRLHLRKFCLQPLSEIAPNVIHPVFAESIEVLLKKQEDDSAVIKVG